MASLDPGHEGRIFSPGQLCLAGHHLRHCGIGHVDAAATLVRTRNQTPRLIAAQTASLYLLKDHSVT